MIDADELGKRLRVYRKLSTLLFCEVSYHISEVIEIGQKLFAIWEKDRERP